MADVLHTPTDAELAARFGVALLPRIRREPTPGSATEADIDRVRRQTGRICELIDGVLIEKSMGQRESGLNACILAYLFLFVQTHRLGYTLGPDGGVQLAPGRVRDPDCSFWSWNRLPDRQVPNTAFVEIAPDLAVEVLSPGNSDAEMLEKLHDYFDHGTRLVWLVDPQSRKISVHTSPTDATVLHESDTLTGGEVLPGFTLAIRDVFAVLDAPEEG